MEMQTESVETCPDIVEAIGAEPRPMIGVLTHKPSEVSSCQPQLEHAGGLWDGL